METIKTSEIRPEEAESKYNELYQQEICRLIDPNTGKVKSHLLNLRDCPVCLNGNFTKSFCKDGFSFVTCNECGLLYVNPSLRNDVLKEYYENSAAMDFFQQHILTPTRQIRNEKIFKPRVEFVERYVSGGKLLDVGCAIGNFLECLKDKPRWDISGVEPNTGAAEYIRTNLGLAVDNCLLEETEYLEGSFDVITLWETIEHLQNPVEVLEYCFRLLRKDGLFFVSTPNIDGLEFKIAGEQHFNIAAPNHLNYFSSSTLGQLLERTGFKEVEITTPGRMDVENIKIFLGQGLGCEVAGTFLTSLILDEGGQTQRLKTSLQNFITESNLSGNMVGVCRKL